MALLTPSTRPGPARSAPAALAWLGVALVLGALVAWPSKPGQGPTAFAGDGQAETPPAAGPECAHPLTHQTEHDRELAREANQVLAEILGPGRARVSVRSEWDFTHHTETSERPGRRVVLHESRTVLDEPVHDGPAITEEKEYSAARSSEERVSSVPRLERLHVALFLDQSAPDSPDLRGAVQTAVGFDPRRGDEFRTVVLPFARSVAAVPETARTRGTFGELVPWLLLAAAGAAWLRWRPRTPQLAPVAAAPRLAPVSVPAVAREPEPALPASAARARVGALLAAEPERVGAVLSRWAREEPVEGPR